MDTNIEIARLQDKIRNLLDLEQVIFDFQQKENIAQLNLITVNPRHEQSFLYHVTEGINKIEALEKMLEYVEKHHKKENSYTMQWVKKGENELHTSYFRAKNMFEVLDKFSFGRNMNEYSIYTITLNPVS